MRNKSPMAFILGVVKFILYIINMKRILFLLLTSFCLIGCTPSNEGIQTPSNFFEENGSVLEDADSKTFYFATEEHPDYLTSVTHTISKVEGTSSYKVDSLRVTEKKKDEMVIIFDEGKFNEASIRYSSEEYDVLTVSFTPVVNLVYGSYIEYRMGDITDIKDVESDPHRSKSIIFSEYRKGCTELLNIQQNYINKFFKEHNIEQIIGGLDYED